METRWFGAASWGLLLGIAALALSPLLVKGFAMYFRATAEKRTARIVARLGTKR